ncbi:MULTISPECIES: hypothetical protein [Streptomyces]|uniref:hypothetical protein n=1 Tax=Streptomyces TaxID=1883 RepID=UPI001300BF10|nr:MULTISPECIES: hypothetical protein [Streptomyces]MYS63457.1 hypothetical protein [Streptomyces sp. SID5473]
MATALTGPAPCPLTANCLRCGRITYAPVPVRWVENAVRYAEAFADILSTKGDEAR